MRAIRSLMERSTIYRAISAPTALVGGVVGMIVGAVLWFQGGRAEEPPGPGTFVVTWLLTYVVIDAFNFSMIHRNARNRGESFLSPGLKHAVRALAPPMACGCIAGASFALIKGDPALCAITWVTFFGIALLSTSSFAPRSIGWLGAAFTAAGVVMLPLYLTLDPAGHINRFQIACLIMAGTFGLFHIVYAAAITGAQAVGTKRTEGPNPLTSTSPSE